MSLKTTVPGQAANELRTSDDLLIRGLLMLKHRPVRIEVENDSMIHYIFNKDVVDADVRSLLSNEDIAVKISDVWAANQVWTMNLRRARSSQ